MSKINWNPDNKPDDECWLYDGYVRSDGYRLVYKCDISSYAHRLSWIDNRGPIPHGLLVLHRCDNRGCANPNHLYLGNQSKNMADKITRLKPGVKIGRTAYMFKENDILAMKYLRDKGESYVKIASMFGCSRQYVTLLLKGERGKNIQFRQ